MPGMRAFGCHQTGSAERASEVQMRKSLVFPSWQTCNLLAITCNAEVSRGGVGLTAV